MRNDTDDVIPDYLNLAILHNWLLANRDRLKSQYVLNKWLDDRDPDMVEANVFGLAMTSGVPQLAWNEQHDWNGMYGLHGEKAKSWPRYMERVFGLQMKSAEYSWIESCRWRGVDDDLDGAIARIRFVLDNALELPGLGELVSILAGELPIPYDKTQAKLYDLSKTL